jgi:hypothetical protein
LSKLLKLWHDKSEFPIVFVTFDAYQDQTRHVIDDLNHLTPEIKSLFSMIATSLQGTHQAD